MTTAQVGKCSECNAPIRADAPFCRACGVSFRGHVDPVQYDFWLVRFKNHQDLEDMVNYAAALGWEPVNAYAWNTSATMADHACLLRRPIPAD